MDTPTPPRAKPHAFGMPLEKTTVGGIALFRTRRAGLYALFAVAAALATVGGAPGFIHSVPPSLATPHRTSAGLGQSSSAGFPTPIRHVVVVWFENKDLGQVLREKAPFERYLAIHYALAGQFYSVRHGSEPDYIAGTSGADPTVFRTGGYKFTNIGDLARNASESWTGYFESMPTACDNQDNWTVGYEKSHNPFVQYSDVWHNWAYCHKNVVPFVPSSWNASVAAGTLPNYVMLEPNIFHDQHSGTLGAGDSWLRSVLNPLLNASVFSSTAVFVTYDEALNGGIDGRLVDDSGYNGTAVSDAGQIYTVVASPLARFGYNSSHPYQTYSLLTTAEWLLGLGRTGQNDSWAQFPPMTDLFTTNPATTKGPYTLSGEVANQSSGLPVGGAHVVAADAHYAYGVDTSASGTYSLPTSAGSRSLYVCASGYACFDKELPQNFTVTGSRSGLNFALVPLKVAQFHVSGTVTNSLTKAPIPNASVVINGPGLLKVPLTNSKGMYLVWLTNGTYTFTAVVSGCQSQSKTVTVSGHPLTVSFALTCGASVPLAASPASSPTAAGVSRLARAKE